MTVIYANSGDRDTVLLQAIWQGLHVDTYIEIGYDDYDYEDAVEAALINEGDKKKREDYEYKEYLRLKEKLDKK